VAAACDFIVRAAPIAAAPFPAFIDVFHP